MVKAQIDANIMLGLDDNAGTPNDKIPQTFISNVNIPNAITADWPQSQLSCISMFNSRKKTMLPHRKELSGIKASLAQATLVMHNGANSRENQAEITLLF